MAKPVGRPGETRERVVRAALELFAEHGVNGTSLQMIANRLDVTKAAVYHQFATKDEIVIAVVQPALDRMRRFVEDAEAQRTRAAQVDVTLRGLIELVVGHSRLAAVFRGDPAVATVVATHPSTRTLGDRVNALLAGPDPGLATRVAVAMVVAGIIAVGSDQLRATTDDETLRRELLALAHRLLDPAEGATGQRAVSGHPAGVRPTT